MKTGKISESVLTRSVLKYIEKNNEEITKGAGIGEDCAFLSYQNAQIATCTQTFSLPVQNAAFFAVLAATNNLAAAGAIGKAVSVSLTLPVDFQEENLKQLMQQLVWGCRESQVLLLGGHTEVSKAVLTPVISVTAFGHSLNHNEMNNTAFVKQNQNLDLVVTKWIGLEGSCIIANEKEKELLARYPHRMIQDAKDFLSLLSIKKEAALALKSGALRMHDIRNGGVFGALWEISRVLGTGLNVDLKKIPIKQETIELCEFYDLNPYILLSGGSLLIAATDGDLLVQKLEENGVFAKVIGQTTQGNDKIIQNRDEIRFLEPTMPDEIWKLNF